ncbi:hypothetical protein PS2_035256 [Malus domestica]
MDLSSWFRRKLLKNSEKTSNPDPSEQTLLPQQNEREEEQLGVTEQLVDLVKSFTLDTFRNFPLPDDEGAEEDEDLSGWQERHATIVLSRVKELSHLRYKLCPRYLKERQFWRVYFVLVKKQVADVWNILIAPDGALDSYSLPIIGPVKTGLEKRIKQTRSIHLNELEYSTFSWNWFGQTHRLRLHRNTYVLHLNQIAPSS